MFSRGSGLISSLERKISRTPSPQPQSHVTYDDEPIPFITLDDEQFNISEKARDILASIKGPIAVVSVAGLYRTGKSYILNRILGRQSGFPVGPTINPCTKGIWMWGKPVKHVTATGEQLTVIFLDAEGMGAIEQTQNRDIRIFSLCVLLSSLFIYNSLGNIDETAISNLALVVNLTKHIHVKANNDEDDGTQFQAFFPAFLWLVRDFTLQLVDQDNNEISAREYLENSLKAQPGFSEKIASKNRIRSMLTTFFRERDCVALVRPLTMEADLQKLDKLPYEMTRPEFRNQVESFKNKVFMSAKPKALHGQLLDGEMYVAMTESYVNALNGGGVPTLSDAWERVVATANASAVELAVASYFEDLKSKTNGRFPMKAEELSEIHKASKKISQRVFRERSIGQSRDLHEPDLEAQVTRIYRKCKQDNYDASLENCNALLHDLYLFIDVTLAEDRYRNFQEYEVDRSKVAQQYNESAVGPATKQAYSAFIERKLTECISHFQNQIHHSVEKSHSKLEDRVMLAERKVLEESLVHEREKSELKAAKADVERRLAEVLGREEANVSIQEEHAQRMNVAEDRVRELAAQLSQESGRQMAAKEQIAVIKEEYEAQIADLKEQMERRVAVEVERQTLRLKEDLENTQQDLKVARGALDVKNSQLESLKEKLTSANVELRVAEEQMALVQSGQKECCTIQ